MFNDNHMRLSQQCTITSLRNVSEIQVLPAFTHATQQYGLQRGHRMALKALRDGKPLDIFSYREYGELIRTADAPETILECESTSPDYVYRITACPWHMQFEKMGALEAGAAYCSEIDEALYRGFNPDIEFTAPCNLSKDCFCRHVTAECFSLQSS